MNGLNGLKEQFVRKNAVEVLLQTHEAKPEKLPLVEHVKDLLNEQRLVTPQFAFLIHRIAFGALGLHGLAMLSAAMVCPKF